MKTIKCFCFLFLIMRLTTSSQVLVDPYRGLHVSVDTFLINNGDVWNIKTSFKAAFSKVPKTKFGPFETIVTDQKKFRIDKQKDHNVDFSKGTGGITSTINTTDSISNTLTVLYNATDSIIVNIFIRTFTENTRPAILFGKQDQPDEIRSVTYWDETFIKIKSDTASWHMWGLGNLCNTMAADSFEINKANGFTIGKKRKPDLYGISTGYVFLHDGKQQGAVETYPEINVWLRKDLNDQYKQILGGAIISILTTRVK